MIIRESDIQKAIKTVLSEYIENNNNMAKNTYIKSPMNYTGGKHKLLPQIMALMPKPQTSESQFIDMFTGGANVIANIQGYKRVANDFSRQVVEIYQAFQKYPIDDIIDYIQKKISEYGLSKENKEGYLKFRQDYNQSSNKNPLDLFILICYSFNNQIRFNKKDEYNMPFGLNRSSFNSSIENNLRNIHSALKDVEFYNKDFREVDVSQLKPGDYVYCDPPYLVTCASYNEQDGWNAQHEKDLLDLLDKLDANGIYFGLSNVLSNGDKKNDILISWINNRDYAVHRLNHTYANCSYHKKDKKTPAEEVFITNYRK